MATVKQKYYAYYNRKTGAILSVTNEKSSTFENGLEVDFSLVEGLLAGTENFKDYVVGYKKLLDGGTILTVLPAENIEGFTFKNSVFEWITDNPHAECIVEWNGPESTWNISLADKATYGDYILTSKLVFFVTLESDLNFLVRTIYVDLQELLVHGFVKIPFTTSIEHKIEKISISSKLVFKTYGLKVTK